VLPGPLAFRSSQAISTQIARFLDRQNFIVASQSSPSELLTIAAN
jgi:hypothetical protein